VTDDTRVGARAPEPAEPGTTDTEATDASTTDASTTDAVEEPEASGDAADTPAPGGRRARRAARPVASEDTAAGDTAAADDDEQPARGRRGATLPLVPVLAALLVLLLAGTGFLWFTRPGTSAVATADYVDALQAARAGIVDVASFDYLTLDDDISQIQAVTTGDLATDSVDQLNSRRQDITDSQAVVNTEVVGAAVGAADDASATVFMVIQSTQTTGASQQAQVQRYRIEVDLTKDGDRWLLSGISGR
jgi:Mce-associated membrane protein